jgi:hypothetical protein
MKFSCPALWGALLAGISADAAFGTILVREGFENYVNTGATLTDVATHATGLTGNWTAGSTNVLIAGSLAFSDYSVASSGNSLSSPMERMETSSGRRSH